MTETPTSTPDAPPVEPAVWVLPNGDTIPKRIDLPPLPGVRDHTVTVTFRNPRELRAGDREDALAAVPAATNRAATSAVLMRVCAQLVIDSWGFNDLPLPRVTPDSMRLLEIPDYDAITEAVYPVLEVLFPTPAVADSGPNRPTGSSSR